MKIIGLLLFLVIMVSTAFPQVSLLNLTFEKALKKARLEKKVLMVIMDSKGCQRCNAVAKQALADPKAYAINKLAISIELEPDGPDWESLGAKYYKYPASRFGTLFFNANGQLIRRYDRLTTNGADYLTEVSLALQNTTLPNEINKLEKKLTGTDYGNLGELDQLRIKRQQLQLPTEDLLDAFIASTPIDSFAVPDYWQLLARFAPILGSKADSILRQRPGFNRDWLLLDQKERVAINQQVANKTWAKAVADKDYLLEERLADFAGNIHENATAANRSSNRIHHLQNFYKAVGDTAEYIRFATLWVDFVLMKWKPDSLRNFYVHRAATIGPIKDASNNDVNPPYRLAVENFANQLNNAAWNFYEMSHDTADWRKALTWAKRGLEYAVSPELLDTYAQLLYVTGNREEAIVQEKKVIEEKRKARREKDVPITEHILARMENGASKVAESFYLKPEAVKPSKQ